jgi:hypothetical protein
MTRLFRRPGSRIADWFALGVFAEAYLSTLALVLIPGLAEGSP